MGVRQVPGGPGAETYTELLQKSMTPYITTQVSAHNAKRRLTECSQHPEEFLNKYDELKARNVHDLDSLVFLLSKLSDDIQVKDLLKKTVDERSIGTNISLTSSTGGAGVRYSASTATGVRVTPEELEKIKAQLMKVTSENVVTSSDILRKALRDKHAKRTASLPVQPDWMFHRPYLTMDFVHDVELPDVSTVPIGSMPLQLQESAIIDDLLACTEGVDGKYVHAVPLADRYSQREFRIEPSLDPSLRELVKRILPICSDYSLIARFIEEKSAFEYGLVNHALSAAYRTLIKDYMILIAQLEHQHQLGQLTLQKFWFYIQPTMRTMEIMASIANSINKGECIGGSVLSRLHEKTSSLIGDVKGQELCLYLTQAACVPYFEMLEKWIYKGIIHDPYAEFLVEQNNAFQKEKLQEDYNDSYWEQHYTICHERIPLFLESVADKVLNTGKYLNVVRQCGRDVKCPDAQEIIYTIKERQYFEHIEKAYNYASKLLLDLLVEEKDLMARLRSVKHYFLLDQGDFIVQFMDMAEDEMKKTMDDIMQTRLETLLELVLRTSTANIDPYKDDLQVDLLPYDLITQLFRILTIETKQEKDYKVDPVDLHLSGLEAFTFDYIVKWPVSLVISRKALTKYQMLFRHLFYCKHVERQLCSVWLNNKSAKLFVLHSTRWSAPAFALRQRMLNFVQNFEYYMMFEVIEPNWQLFESNMDTVSNLDDVLAYHADFLNNCLKDCMLTSPELLRIVHKLMMVCVTFSNFMQVTLPNIDSGTAGSDNTERTIATFDRNFSHHLVDLLDKIMEFSVSNCEHKLMNILYRLDFNNFYTKQLEMLSAERVRLESSRSLEASTSLRDDRSMDGEGDMQ
jgi:gamma-tubulin complex component 2